MIHAVEMATGQTTEVLGFCVCSYFAVYILLLPRLDSASCTILSCFTSLLISHHLLLLLLLLIFYFESQITRAILPYLITSCK